jgi:SET domain-containing protein
VALSLHRCGDSNLEDILVSVESVNRSFYHVAFFANRIIHPGEELTWDYGTNFNNDDPDLPTFSCKCNSIMCKDNALPTAIGRSTCKPPRSR